MLGGVWIGSQQYQLGNRRCFLLFIWGIASLWFGFNTLRAASSLLRNPESAVFELFPDASYFQSHSAYISLSNQTKIEDKLSVSLSFSDFGQQSILIVFSKGNVPLGIIHVRSEIGPTGVIELAWAMDLDFKLTGMKIQRSRGTQVVFLYKPEFQTNLIGKNADQLLELLLLDYSSLNPNLISVPEKVAHLAHKAILCAAKSLLITQETFGEDLLRHRLVNTLFSHFPSTERVQEIHSESSPFTPQDFKSLVSLPSPSFRGLRGFDDQGKYLGVVVFGRWAQHPNLPEVWWTLDSDLIVQDMKFLPKDLPPTDLAFWEPLKGKPLNQYKTLLPNPPFQAHELLEPIVRKLESEP